MKQAPARVSNLQTRANALAVLAHLGVKTVDMRFSEDHLDNTDRSRFVAIDVNGRILGHCLTKKDKWSEDSGKNHGKGVRRSFRSRTTPSVQVCVQDAAGGEYDYVLKIDLDYHSPVVNLPGHAGEVIKNKVTRGTTDPEKIRQSIIQNLQIAVEAVVAT